MKNERLLEFVCLTRSLVNTLGDQIVNLSRALEERGWENATLDYAIRKAFFRMNDAVLYLEDVEDIIRDKYLKSLGSEEDCADCGAKMDGE